LVSALWPAAQANISLLFGEIPFEQRPAAAAAAGFRDIECWWPFATAAPSSSEVDGFVSSITDAGVRLRGLNFYAGDMPGGERGIASHPQRRGEFDDAVAVAVEIGARLGVTGFNALYGNRLPGLGATDQHDAGTQALAAAAEHAGSIGATVLVEPVSGIEAYPLKLAADALSVIRAARETMRTGRIALLADLYHLTVNGEDVVAVITQHIDEIGHVQVADAPGRHEPGTGAIPIAELVDLLDQHGYTGGIALEYIPSGDTLGGLSWLRELVPSFGDATAEVAG
jgi:hydroxypyruvate isomerase